MLNRGFTLLELLITLALVCLLVGLATPSLKSFLDGHEGTQALRTITEFIVLARSEAATNVRGVTLCPTTAGKECGGKWANGAMVFLDRNFDRELNQDDRVLRVKLVLSEHGTIRWRAFGNRQYIQIDAQGFLRHQSGNFSFCPVSGDPQFARQLVINSVGRVRVAVDSDGDGLRENSKGEALRCD